VVHGLDGLEPPDAIFVGGGIGEVLEPCWDALKPGGRIVANTVTLEGEQVVVAARKRHGGTLTRLDVAHAEPLGGFEGWRAQMTVVQWAAVK
jgi:precorrin-6Y C5,15-methyltransferase (decarboxylating)